VKVNLQRARLLLVPALKVLHIPRHKRGNRIGKRGPIMVVELMKAARRFIHIPKSTQALAMIEQHAQAILLLDDPSNLFQHGEITEEQLREAATELAPAYVEAFSMLGVEILAEAKAKADGKSKPSPNTDSADGDKKGKANPVATEAKARKES